ncbi:hypothetical protein [Chromobacterium haemolyticum]|uniref:hypothetical protein n=1 Tax=Chromobacterium haemolyticum TaxID=394935 RepID=UPI0009D972AD|nr:hypothetical protein [Chromobacterium haemolyticum]OQS41818.1 hypothetical protein B0T39_07730 [Chromobacterium haemolyticum]
MFKLSTSGKAQVKAEFQARAESGALVAVTIHLTGRLMSQPDWDAFFERHSERESVGVGVSGVYRANAQMFAEVFTSWEGVADENGQPLAFSVASLEAALLSVYGPQINEALSRAVHELRYGAVAKN